MELLGDKVSKKGGGEVEVASLAGEGNVVGLYFSAHWCPPCRMFTPQLATWYENFKKSPNGNKFEIVFVSSDKDKNTFDEYYSEMPWLALPFADRDRKSKLSKNFKVTGIPTLVMINGGNGEVITTDGRTLVGDDPSGKDFPWLPKKFSEIIPGKLINKNKKESSWDEVTQDVIGLYFSAHWCGPCRVFTPQLVKTYNKITEEGKSFQIIFLSSDRDEDSFQDYLSEMPWLAVPFGDGRKKTLSRLFHVEGIPTLVIMRRDGEVILTNGRSAITQDPEGKDFPWIPKPVNALNGLVANDINESPSVIFFTNEPEKAKKILTPIAEKHAKNKASKILFFYHTEDEDEEDIGSSLKSFAGLKNEVPLLVLLDIPGQQVHVSEEDFSNADNIADTVSKMVEDYCKGTLNQRSLSS